MQKYFHKIKKGLDIHIPGVAEKIVCATESIGDYAVKPTDYVGMSPRLLVDVGDDVVAGTPLFEDKNNVGVPFVSPVGGKVKAIVRGEKRKLLAVIINQNENRKPQAGCLRTNENENENDDIRKRMIMSGLWTRLRQRPFGIVPAVDSKPKAVFVSAFDSSPLPVDMDFVLQGREEDFEYGIDVLAKVAGKVYLGDVRCKMDDVRCKNEEGRGKNAEIHFFEGPHPAGLVGTQIACISPINKGESVWTVNAQDVAIIGHYFRTGEYRPERVVALCGPCVEKPQYYRVVEGVSMETLVSSQIHGDGCRIICGDVLSGVSVDIDGYLSAACDKVCVIPEGDYYDFLGWLRPNFKKYSFSRTFLSGFIKRKSTKFTFDTGKHGSVRPLFVTGEFEKLTPLNIYPMQLIKACIVGDIELMEELGIYEVEPEDLALCEFADTSKTEIQAIIRESLEKIRKEG